MALTLPESLRATDGTEKDAANSADVSTFDESLSLVSGRPTRQSISTMAVHDSVTGKIRRHAVRKVRCYASAVHAVALCLSICLSITSWSSIKMAEHVIT